MEASYLGGSSLALLAWKYAPQRPDVIDKFRVIDDKHELFRGSIGGLEQDGLLVGLAEEDPTRAEKPTLISLSMARTKLIQELGAESVLTACEYRETGNLSDGLQYTKHVEIVSSPSSPSYPSPRACSPTRPRTSMSPNTHRSTGIHQHHYPILSV